MAVKDELKEQKFDAMLKPALYEQMLKEMEAGEMPAEKHEFSRSFDRKMKRVLKKAGRTEAGYFRNVRVAVAAGVVVVAALGVVTMNVEALRVPIQNMFMGDTHSTLDYGGKKGEIEVPEEYVEYVPEYVLPGYELVYAYGDDDKCYLQYKNLEGVYYSITISSGNKRAAFDTEDGEVLEKRVENYDVIFMKKDEEIWASFVVRNMRYVIEGKLAMKDIEDIIKAMN